MADTTEMQTVAESADAVQTTVDDYHILEVYSITAGMTAGTFVVDLRYEFQGTEYRVAYPYNEDDPYGILAAAIRQWLIDHEGEYTILPYIPPPPAPYLYMIETLWSRMTDEEAEEFDAAVTVASPLKVRKQFLVATSMMSNSELFTWTKNILVGLFGETRANVLLAE